MGQGFATPLLDVPDRLGQHGAALHIQEGRNKRYR